MHTIVHNCDHPFLMHWCADVNGITGAFGPVTTRCSAMLEEGTAAPIVVVAFDGWVGKRCEATIATDKTKRWATREFIAGVYRNVFEKWDMDRMSMVTDASNQPAINMHKALGHKQEGIHEDWFGKDRDGISFGFTKRQWEASRWHPSRRKGD